MNRFCRFVRMLVALAFVSVLLPSCNSMKKVPQDQSLLVSNKAKVHGKGTVSKNDVLNMVVQEPNTRFFGARVKLSFYNWSKPEKNNWWHNKLRDIGEKPAIFDSTSIISSQDRILSYAAGKGYFGPTLTTRIKRFGKDNRKVRVFYDLTLDEPYHIRHIKILNRDDSLADELVHWDKETLLKSGMQYDVSVLNKERTRITDQLQNHGYWAFSKDYLNYVVDSSVGGRQMDVSLYVRPVTSNQRDSLTGRPLTFNHKKYRIGDVYILPVSRSQVSNQHPVYDTVLYEYITKKDKRKGLQGARYYILNQGKPIIRYKPIIQKTFVENGKPYSAQDVRSTYDNLSDIRVFQYANVGMAEKAYDTSLSYYENNVLDCRIQMLQGNRYGFSVEGQLTTSSGIQGVSATVVFQNRNTFGGGEILSLKVRGLYELQATTNNEKNRTFLNTFEAKAEASLEIPRFVIPVNSSGSLRHFRPSSIISVSYSYQNRRDYSRGIFNLNFGYHWRRSGIDHTLGFIDVSTVQMLKKSESFEKILKRYEDTKNYRLIYQYSDHFILTPRYQFTFNDQKAGTDRDFNHLIIDAEVAGSLLYGIFSMTGPRPDDGYKILGLPFSQYARFVADYRHHFVFDKKTELVLRGALGIGYSYGNSTSMPYEKSMFVGGNATLRAWPLYGLGPGSYALPKGSNNFERLGDVMMVFNLEQRFPIISGLRGAVFFDLGNIWIARPNEAFPGGEFKFDRFYREFAFGTGVGLRYDFKFFLIRVDMGIPLRDPSLLGTGDTWVVKDLKWSDLLFNFGIGYPF